MDPVWTYVQTFVGFFWDPSLSANLSKGEFHLICFSLGQFCLLWFGLIFRQNLVPSAVAFFFRLSAGFLVCHGQLVEKF